MRSVCLGAGGAICFANGFAEGSDQEGVTRQQALLQAAGRLAVLGPNCYGYINALDGAALWPDSSAARLCRDRYDASRRRARDRIGVAR